MASSSIPFREKHRPQLHFTARENWLNDPAGLVYFEGRYHLFHQYNPSGAAWGDMHWGHAVSADLIHWEHRPVALHASPETLGYIFTGSAVVDWTNSSGLQFGPTPTLVALFTHSSQTGRQVQSLAYSVDGGDNWRMHPGNPVIDNPGLADFRDPKVFRDEARGRWGMVLAAGDSVRFYVSDNLLDWRHASDFGAGCGAHGGVWECPDLLALCDPRSGGVTWVLIVSLNPGGPNGGSGAQYFLGDFDGERFQARHTETLWLDHGPDNYAGMTWSDTPDPLARRRLIGWMSNWSYAGGLPTAPWRGAMTAPRDLRLIDTEEGVRLAAPPVPELAQLRAGPPLELDAAELAAPLALDGGGALPPLFEARLRIAGGADWSLSLSNRGGEGLVLRRLGGQLEIDRSRAASGLEAVDEFRRLIVAPLPASAEPLEIHILKDVASLEVWLGDGRALATLNYFVDAPLDALLLTPASPERPLRGLESRIQPLAGIWERAATGDGSAGSDRRRALGA